MRRPIAMLLATVSLAFGLAVSPITAPSAAAATCRISAPSSAYADQVTTSAGHARVWRLYQAFFLRQPDQNGFDYWARVRSQGARLTDIAYQFANGEEFRARYGNLDDGRFVDLVYRNVLCRTADANGRAYWLGLLRRGELTRWDMMINFVELREYLRRTGTCHSVYPAESAAASCPSATRPLAQATLGTDGYRERNMTVSRWGGGNGSFRGVEVDLTRNVFETGTERCAIASINGNWTVASQKDRPDPDVLGIAVVDGVHLRGSSDRTDRGIVGLRFDRTPKDVVEVWPGDTKSADDTRLSSVMHHRGAVSIENWYASAEMSPYLREIEPEQIVAPHEWVWAAAGMPLRVDGQTYKNFMSDYVNDPYTHQTRRHPFLAVDQDTNRLVFGATQDLDTRDLVVWAENNGYEDLVKFDGGGSAEFNVGGRAVVAGTPRDIPLWLGVGC